MKKWFVVFLVFIAGSVFGQDTEALFRKGNELYQKSMYDSAVSCYNKVIYSGKISPEVYFNLGNCYYKLKKTAPAILNYEKALKLKSNDADVEFNLSVANLLVVDKITPVPQLFYIRWWKSLGNILTGDSWGWLAVSCSWITLLSAVFFVLFQNPGIKKFLFFLGLFAAMFVILFYFLGQKQNELSNTESEAIVFDNSVYIKSSPDEKGVDLFILHEGVKVTLLDEIGDWKKIRIANGNEGWVKREVVEAI